MFFVTFDDGGVPAVVDRRRSSSCPRSCGWAPTSSGPAAVGPCSSAPASSARGPRCSRSPRSVFDLPFTFLDAFFYGFGSSFEDDGFSYEDSTGFGGSGFPDPTTVGPALARHRHRLPRHQPLARSARATRGRPRRFARAAFPALAVGVAFLGEELEALGAGLVLTAIGPGSRCHGSRPGAAAPPGSAAARARRAGDLRRRPHRRRHARRAALRRGLGVAMVAVAHAR